MKNKHGFLFGFAVIAMAAIFTFAGCEDSSDDDDGGGGGGGPTFPTVFAGEIGQYGYPEQKWEPTGDYDLTTAIKFINFNNVGYLTVYRGDDTWGRYNLTGAVTDGGTAASGTFKVKRELDTLGNLGPEFTVTYEYSTTPSETLKLTTSTGNTDSATWNGWAPNDPFKDGVTYAKAAD